MSAQKMKALVKVELKKLYRSPMSLVVMVLMPVGLTVIFYLAMSNITNDYLDNVTFKVPDRFSGILVEISETSCGYPDVRSLILRPVPVPIVAKA